MLRTAAVDYEADPMLLQSCPKSIDICKARVDLTAGKAKEDGGLIEGVIFFSVMSIERMKNSIFVFRVFEKPFGERRVIC